MATVAERQAVETLALELSAALVALDGASFDDGVGRALERIVLALDLDAAMLGVADGEAIVTAAARPRAAAPDVAWPVRRVLAGEVARLDAAGSVTIVCPVSVGASVAGAVAFRSCRGHDGADDSMGRLRLVAQSFAAALRAERDRERLRPGRTLADTIIEALPGLFFILDERGHLLRWNRNHEVVLGMTGDQLRGAHFHDYMHPDFHAQADLDFARVLTEGEGSAEFDLLHVDGRRVPHLTSARRFEEDDRVRVVGVGIDVSGLRAAEEQVRRQQTELAHVARVSAVGELVAAIAHELNQPLGAIRANAQAGERMMLASTIDAGEITDAFRDIASDAYRADEIIKRLGELLRKGETERTLVGVNDLVRGVERLARADATQRGVGLRLDLAADLPPVAGDGIQIQQVVLNLVRNAVDAMRGIPGTPPVVVHTSFDGSETIVVTVADVGPAIDDAAFARMFEPFHTTKPTGLGIGLSLSRSIVEAHGGLLWATRNWGRGLTLHFTLPVATATPAASPGRAGHGDPGGSRTDDVRRAPPGCGRGRRALG